MGRNILSQKTFLWITCACISAYVGYRYWKKRKLISIDEGFVEASKIMDNLQRRVLLLGLKGAGKTSLMNQIYVANGNDMNYSVPPQPTEGSLVNTLQNGSYIYNIWEIGGADGLVTYWTMFLNDTDLIIFVVDSSDTEKLSLAASSLKRLLGDSRIDKTPVLIVANKQDCPNALKLEEVKEALDLLSISQRKHKVEVIGCQTKPFPEQLEKQNKCTWYHSSVDAVKKKIFSMAVS